MYVTTELDGVCAFLAMMGLRLSAPRAHFPAVTRPSLSPITGPCLPTTVLLFFTWLIGAARRTVMLLVWAGALAARPLSRAKVKLVHQRIESGEAGMFFQAITSPREATSIRVEHESVGTEGRPRTGPATARCLLLHAMVHSARSCTRRNAAF